MYVNFYTCLVCMALQPRIRAVPALRCVTTRPRKSVHWREHFLWFLVSEVLANGESVLLLRVRDRTTHQWHVAKEKQREREEARPLSFLQRILLVT